jgi:hypothetical protein
MGRNNFLGLFYPHFSTAAEGLVPASGEINVMAPLDFAKPLFD